METGERRFYRSPKEHTTASYGGSYPDYSKKKWNWCTDSYCTCSRERIFSPTMATYQPLPPPPPVRQQPYSKLCPCLTVPSPSVSWGIRNKYTKRGENMCRTPPQYSNQYHQQKHCRTAETQTSNLYCQLCEDEKRIRFIQTWKKRMMLPSPTANRQPSSSNIIAPVKLGTMHNVMNINSNSIKMDSTKNPPTNTNNVVLINDYKRIPLQQDRMTKTTPSPSSQPKISINNKPARKKKFQCSYCEKSFAKSSHLRDHHRTHSGERPFVCKFCGKAFSQFSNLRTHLRIHTGEKPFQCHICKKAFTQRVTLRSHIRTHAM